MTLKSYIIGVKVFAVVGIVYWALLWFVFPDAATVYFDASGVLLTLMALLGVIVGFRIRREWGGFKSTVGKSITFVSLSLLAWFVAQVTFLATYYIIGDVPYPGLPDIFFVLIDPFYAVALLLMIRYSGATANLGSSKSLGKFLLLVVPLLCIYMNYKIFIGDLSIFQNMDGAIFFDLIYTFGSIMVITLLVLVFLLSINKLGGMMRMALYILFVGFVLQYIGDVIYTLRIAEDIYYNGDIADFVFFLSIVAVTVGLARMNTDRLDTSNNEDVNNET